MSELALRVALLRGDDAHNLYLDSLLRREFEVVAVVEEPGLEQRRVLRRPGKWRDAVAAEYHHLRRRMLGLNRFRLGFFSGTLVADRLSAAPAPDLTVTCINDPAVIGLIQARRPDVCVITCVTILQASAIDAIGVPIVNIHGGHLPDYRGCHCFFFALSDGRFDKIGSTIHFVDSGIDTGDIITIARPAMSNEDTPETLYCKAEYLAGRLLVDHLRMMEAGEPIPLTPQTFRGRLCLRRHRRPMDDIRFMWRRRTGRLCFPTVAEGERWQPGADVR
jgi:methionyl-tRNA formyltransferase